jgi:threonine synthase
MRNIVHPASIGDDLTLKTMESAWKKYEMHIDPHTAVGLAAAEKIIAANDWKGHAHTVVLSTGHPAREANTVKEATGQAVVVPQPLLALQKRCDPIAVIPAQLEAFEGAIASCF